MSRPTAVAIRCTSSGSKVAAQASGVGYTVAPNVANPVRHSSWTSAGTPRREAPTTARCWRTSSAAPSATVTGRLP